MFRTKKNVYDTGCSGPVSVPVQRQRSLCWELGGSASPGWKWILFWVIRKVDLKCWFPWEFEFLCLDEPFPSGSCWCCREALERPSLMAPWCHVSFLAHQTVCFPRVGTGSYPLHSPEPGVWAYSGPSIRLSIPVCPLLVECWWVRFCVLCRVILGRGYKTPAFHRNI
jgi:hypothetical protein